MKRIARSLAIAVLLAGVVVAYGPVLDSLAHSAAAQPSGVMVTATVRALVVPTHLPLTGLQASAQGYVISVNWTNPAAPYSGTLIEWYTDRAHQGTGDNWTRHQYETYYPPASWAYLSAPLGARYVLEGSAYYDGGTTMSAPAVASVLVTAPVDLSNTCPASGYAASAILDSRYGDTTYRRMFVTELRVPGGGANFSMGSNPISWSPQLLADPAVAVCVLTPTPAKPGSGSPKGVTTHYWRPLRTGRASFSDGYPALCSFALTSTVPGTYKLVMSGVLKEGFAHRGEQSWKATRYITLATTRFGTKLSTPNVKGSGHTKKITFAGTINPGRVAAVRVVIQCRVRGMWRLYKNVGVKTKSNGTWVSKILVKKAGVFRVQTTTVGKIADRYHEYASGRSGWRGFRVR